MKTTGCPEKSESLPPQVKLSIQACTHCMISERRQIIWSIYYLCTTAVQMFEYLRHSSVNKKLLLEDGNKNFISLMLIETAMSSCTIKAAVDIQFYMTDYCKFQFQYD